MQKENFPELSDVRLIILDVDGTLTDGGIYYDNEGREFKKFSVKDGLGIIQTQQTGIDFMILTGRSSSIVEKRAKELKVKYLFQGILDKTAFLLDFFNERNIPTSKVAYIGDDLNDYEAMQLVALKACPADAVPEIREISNFILSRNGGDGAVREFTDMVMYARRTSQTAVKTNVQ